MKWLLALLATLIVAGLVVAEDRYPYSQRGGDDAFVDVRDFGAVGDGVTDDTTSIQAALNSFGQTCAEGAGGIVFFPRGVYMISDVVNVPGCVRALGENRNGSSLKATSTFPTSGVAMVTLCEEASAGSMNCLLDHMALNGNNRAEYCVTSQRMQEGGGLQHVQIDNCVTNFVWVRNAASGTDPANYLIRDVEIIGPAVCDGTDNALLLEGNAPAVIENISMTGCGTDTGGMDCVQVTSGAGAQHSFHLANLHCEMSGAAVRSSTTNLLISRVTHLTNIVGNASIVLTNGGHTIYGLDTNATNGISDTFLGLTKPGDAAYYTQNNTLVRVEATATYTCSAAIQGWSFYDTNAGAAGTADDGTLCCCGDDAAQGYLWRDCATPTAELAGASTTDCGT